MCVMWWITGIQQVARPHCSEVCIYTSAYICECLCDVENKHAKKTRLGENLEIAGPHLKLVDVVNGSRLNHILLPFI